MSSSLPRFRTALRCLRPTGGPAVGLSRTASSPVAVRGFATSAARLGGGGNGNNFDPPTGWLWGVKPGEKAEKEGWEGPVYYVFLPSFVVLAIALAFKPDTSLDTWALEEARRRLEKEGILPDPFPEKKN
ncbi:NADH ubiquinone oxidoreductase 11.6kD subunit [Ceratocystis lukuohia]|uniref:NADH dehydrogenase [ubiquinone] 1 beta subcomplex subunit 11, mitochondrial n=3 Tax=Ceratocystis TaxID=5157 RepID=A0A0F8BR15_CERFI|nr:hypothetical protein CFO_g2669 [Ceratocystis platani]PHH51567.1 hypothetical protein CFIMG_003363RA [Ceratocystis fimbriata CBS 114723]